MRSFFTVLALLASPAFAMEGNVTVKSGSWRVQRDDDDMKVNFYPGSYKTSLSFERDSLYFAVDRKDITTRATLKFPSGANLPENGEVIIDGFRTGQTFAAKGTISTQRTTSADQHGSESCTYYRDEWVCYGYGHNQRCGWERVPMQGWQQVQFHFETKTVALQLALDSKNGGDAAFSGRTVENRKVYTYQGPCY